MARLFGIETEYGLFVEGADPSAMVAESRSVVMAYGGPCVTGWDYAMEDPRQDMRGYRVAQLRQDPDDAIFDSAGARYSSFADEHADRVLPNGARLYNDHGHPEYSSPECTDLRSLVAYDRAGEQIVAECARRYANATGKTVRIYKNNTDYHGASYGTHESYLLRRDLPVELVVRGLAPFLATRQIFAGSGKVGLDNQRDGSVNFQLSQRAEHVDVAASVDTQYRRPLVNTRDEPHAAREKYRRLHVIVGDANLSEWATAMKVGTLALVLDLLESGWKPPFDLVDPVSTIRAISADPSLATRVPVRMESGEGVTGLSPIEVQRHYFEAAANTDSSLPDAGWVLEEWRKVLDDLETEPDSAADRVDWIAKKRLLEDYCADTDAMPNLDELRSVELAYHDLDHENSLYAALRDHDHSVRTLVSDAEIRSAMEQPPFGTRAFVRGHFVRRHTENVVRIGWSRIAFDYEGRNGVFDMSSLVDGRLAESNAALAQAQTMEETLAVLQRYPDVAGVPPLRLQDKEIDT